MKNGCYVKYSENYFKEWLKHSQCSKHCSNYDTGCNLCEESERKRVLKYFGKDIDGTLILSQVIVSKGRKITHGAGHLFLYDEDVYEVELKDHIEILSELYGRSE